jgi:alpha-L-rhamnosidase
VLFPRASLPAIVRGVDTTPRLSPVNGFSLARRSPAPQPWPYVNGGSFNGPDAAGSVDPLLCYRWPDPRPEDGLQLYVLLPEKVDTDTPQSFEGLDTLLSDAPAVVVSGPGTIRLDFGRESAAWFEMDSADCPGGVRLSISEYNQPEYTNVGDKTGVPQRLGDTWRAVFNPELYEGVRFAFIHVDTVPARWAITGIRLVCQVKPANYEGSFSCSNPLLDRVWHMGAYSVKLGNLQHFTTPILIERSDRVQWNGLDFSIMNTANLVAFNARGFVRKQIAATNTPPGINCGIYSFELYDVLSVCDYYRSTGDDSLVRECRPEVEAKLERARERWEPHTEAGTTGFMGWDERLGGFERVTAFNRWNYRLLCIRTWRTWAGLIEGLGDSAAAARYRGYARERIETIRATPRWLESLDVHGCAEALQAGFCTPEEVASLAAGEFTDRVNRVSYSQANTGLILQAMARAGLFDDAIVTIEDQWGATLRYGGTTTFEMFRPSAADVLGPNDPPVNGQCGMTSLCHPWGALVCQYLNEVVAGIVPTSPGFATVDIMPHLGRRLSSASAVSPTPHGPISAMVDTAAGVQSVTLPPGVRGRIGVPKRERRITRISVNGRLAWDGAWHAVPGLTGAAEDEEFVVFDGAGGGTYNLQVSSSGVTPAPLGAGLDYPVRCLGEDRSTRGEWCGRYGTEGYVLPNYEGAAGDARSLPGWVRSVALERCGHLVWQEGTDDPRAPARPPGRSPANSRRTAAAMYTKDPEPTYQTMMADITAEPGRDWRLGLYFLDWDDAGRSVGVQIIDPVSLKQLAPVQVVRSFRDGVYLSYAVRGSLRVRVDTITRPNATLSGIFFDPPAPARQPTG